MHYLKLCRVVLRSQCSCSQLSHVTVHKIAHLYKKNYIRSHYLDDFLTDKNLAIYHYKRQKLSSLNAYQTHKFKKTGLLNINCSELVRRSFRWVNVALQKQMPFDATCVMSWMVSIKTKKKGLSGIWFFLVTPRLTRKK